MKRLYSSCAAYAWQEKNRYPDGFLATKKAFISDRDSCYMATGEEGVFYLQHTAMETELLWTAMFNNNLKPP